MPVIHSARHRESITLNLAKKPKPSVEEKMVNVGTTALLYNGEDNSKLRASYQKSAQEAKTRKWVSVAIGVTLLCAGIILAATLPGNYSSFNSVGKLTAIGMVEMPLVITGGVAFLLLSIWEWFEEEGYKAKINRELGVAALERLSQAELKEIREQLPCYNPNFKIKIQAIPETSAGKIVIVSLQKNGMFFHQLYAYDECPEHVKINLDALGEKRHNDRDNAMEILERSMRPHSLMLSPLRETEHKMATVVIGEVTGPTV